MSRDTLMFRLTLTPSPFVCMKYVTKNIQPIINDNVLELVKKKILLMRYQIVKLIVKYSSILTCLNYLLFLRPLLMASTQSLYFIYEHTLTNIPSITFTHLFSLLVRCWFLWKMPHQQTNNPVPPFLLLYVRERTICHSITNLRFNKKI